MAWKLEQVEDGWKWFIMQSAYGAGGGVEPTKAQAIVEMLVCEAEITEQPIPRPAVEWMRANPELAAVDYLEEPSER